MVSRRKCWMDNIKEWTSLPMPELLTRASCRKDGKRISAESSLMSPHWTNWSRDWTELNWAESTQFSWHFNTDLLGVKLTTDGPECPPPKKKKKEKKKKKKVWWQWSSLVSVKCSGDRLSFKHCYSTHDAFIRHTRIPCLFENFCACDNKKALLSLKDLLCTS